MDKYLPTIGFLFTLTSLLGTFFYVQLSNWFRDVLELNKKYELNKTKANAEMQSAMRDCRYEYVKTFNFVPFLTTIIVSGFLGYISYLSFCLLNQIKENSMARDAIINALTVFLFIYVVMVLGFIVGGIVYAIKLRKVNE